MGLFQCAGSGIPELQIVFASSTFGGVSTILKPPFEGGLNCTDSEVTGVYEHVQDENQSFAVALTTTDKHQPLIFEGIEDENSELSDDKAPDVLLLPALSRWFSSNRIHVAHFGKRLVYFENQYCFRPLQELYLLLEVFRL